MNKNSGTINGATYPVQTSEHTPHINEDFSGPEDKKLPLPENLRALRDANDTSRIGRTLIICLDGTGDQFDNDNSNVVHFVSCLKKDDPSRQVTYYQSGIGTYDKVGLKNGISAGLDMAVGSGLGIHIKDAYRFLMQNYRENDRICLFGFSRGAYTVRCLAGMLHKVGLLPAGNGAQVNFAYRFYKDDTPEGWSMSADFKKTFCVNVNVYFVGVWDCVASVGFVPRKLPFTKSPTRAQYFRHAMAMDEKRAKFKILQWQQQDPDVARANTIDNTPKGKVERELKRSGIFNCFKSKKSNPSQINGTNNSNTNGNKKDSIDQERLQAEFEKQDRTVKPHERIQTDAKEVWFMGAHADCGGGAVANETRHMLSRIPLRWMIRQCFEADTGILFSCAPLADQGLDLHTLWPEYRTPSIPKLGPSPHVLEKYESGLLPALQRRSTALGEVRRGTNGAMPDNFDPLELLPEQVEDHLDSMAPINDQLAQAKGWWVLEAWPIKVRIQQKDTDMWEKKVRPNLGRARAVRETAPKMHWTVQQRVDAGKYKIPNRVDRRATWEVTA